MRWHGAVLSVLLVLAFGNAWAGWDEGKAAYDRGDYATAMRQWRPLAEQGNADAQFYLGFMYALGQGVPQDHAEAAKRYRTAAAQGDAEAQFYLGVAYGRGRGVTQDYAKSAKWFRLAAEQGFALGQNNLGVVYQVGRGVPQDYVQAHMWYNLATIRSEEAAIKNRDVLARYMTPAQLAEAQRLAREWTEKHGN